MNGEHRSQTAMVAGDCRLRDDGRDEGLRRFNAIMRWTGHDSASMELHYAWAMGQDDVFAEFKKVS